MASPTGPWPCPVCAELIPFGFHDCPSCFTPAAWIERIGALDFSIRRFHYWNTIGWLSREKYRPIVDACRRRREAMVLAAQAGQSAFENQDVTRADCWKCGQPIKPSIPRCAKCGATLDRPEVRHFRHLTFLDREIQAQEQAGRLTAAEAKQLQGDTQRNLQEIKQRVMSG